jgi:hypothetical protein
MKIASMLGAGLLALAAGADAAQQAMNGVSEKIQVDTRNGKVLVRVTIENKGERTVYLPRALALDKQLVGPLFEIRDSSNGDPIDYIGPMVKRAPLGPGDFVALKPHARLRNTIDITRDYAFMQGRHTYQLSYAGGYLTDLNQLDQVTPVEVEPVLFSHVGK